MTDNLKTIPLAQIRENPVALREVDRESEDYLQLVDSIREHGVLQPILVRPIDDPENPEGDPIYGLCDGLHRFTGAMDAGLDVIPAHVMDFNEAEVMYKQIVTNIHKVQTKPVEYSRQLQRILAMEPTLTRTELASRLNKTTTWISERLGLLKLVDGVAELVDDGKINLSNAYALAKLPTEEQPDWVEKAMTMTPDEFTNEAMARRGEIAKAKREGKTPGEAQYVPTPKLQKLKDVKAELESATAGPELVKHTGVKSAVDGFALGVQWAAKMDPISIEVARRKWEEHRQATKDRREEAKKERKERQAKEAHIRADRITLEAELYKKGVADEEVNAALKEFDDKHGLVDGKFVKEKKEGEEG